MANEAKGRARKFTDDQLRTDLDAGLKPAEIALKYEVSAAAVSQRIKRLKVTTVAAAVAPEESRRYVGAQLVELEQLVQNLARVNLLADACDRWLRDPDYPNRYDVGPRADEVTVIYEELTAESTRKVRKSLAALLREIREGHSDVYRIAGAESKYADPRELILRTLQESRAIVTAGIDLMERIQSAKAQEAFRTEVLAAFAELEPERAEAVQERIRRRLRGLGLIAGPGEGHSG